MDDISYKKHMAEKFQKYEDLCKRCGACCGAFDGDPCLHLQKNESGYFCKIYDKRLGMRKTIKGHIFECVEVKTILDIPWIGDKLCSYKK